MSTRIGCDNLVYALMTTEDSPTVEPVYGTPVALAGVISIGVNPNASQETLFADDGPLEVSSTLGRIEVEINKNEITTAQRAAVLGHGIDTKGAIVYGSSDTPPWLALGFRTLKSSGVYKYVWLYKGRFMDMEEQYETKNDGVNFQTDTIKAQFAKLAYPYTVDSAERYPWKYEIDDDDAGADAPTIAAWFTAVTLPTEDV